MRTDWITYSRWTLFVALCISVIAAWYSVVGLAAIFAGAVLPIIIMGGILEIAKITTTVWLHRHWHQAGRLMRIYLTVAVIVLACLTSMGIFGLLSKAHLEQTGAAENNQAVADRLTAEIERNQALVARARERIQQLESTGTGQAAQAQAQIDREQARIDSVIARSEPQIREQREIIARAGGGANTGRLERVEGDLDRLQALLQRNDVAGAQALVGVRADGQMGPQTQRAIQAYREGLQAERTRLQAAAQAAATSPEVRAAQAEIQRIRQSVEAQVSQSNELINRLRSQIGTGQAANIDGLVDEQNQRITTAQAEIERLTDERFRAQSEVRKIEAEVGPVKYIAALIYGDNPDADTLERAVRWVIILIVAVFDPLAIVLILAAQNSLSWDRETRELQERMIAARESAEPAPTVSTVAEVQPSDEPPDDLFPTFEEITPAPAPSEPEPVPQAEVPRHTEQPVRPVSFSQWPGVEFTYTYVPRPHKQTEPLTEPAPLSEPQPEPTEPEPQAEIQTEGMTTELPVFAANTEYVTYDGKLTSIAALREIRPDLVAAMRDSQIQIGLGREFPTEAHVGDLYIRVDTVPHRVYKFNSVKWMAVDKTQNTSYLQNTTYVQYLIELLDKQGYDPEYLTEAEQEEIRSYLAGDK